MGEQQLTVQNATVRLLDSNLYFVFPFVHARALSCLRETRQRMASLTIADLNDTLGVTLNESQARKARSPDFTVWAEKPFPIDGNYFHEFVQAIFGNDRVGESGIELADSRSLAPLELTSMARNLISGGFGKASEGLCVNVTAAGRQRLMHAGYEAPSVRLNGETQHYLRFQIAGAHCLFFGTGVAMIVVQVEAPGCALDGKQIPIEYVLELNNQLCRANYWSSALKKHRCWRFSDAVSAPPCDGESNPDGIGTLRGIGPICTALTGEAANQDSEPEQINAIHWKKVATFSGVKTTPFASAESRDLDCIRLARKETSDYHPYRETISDSIYRPFSYLTHTASIEGGVLLVEVDEGNDTPDFVKNFITNPTARAYLPLMLWSLHEFIFLTELSKSATGWIDFVSPDEGHRVLLHDFRARLYNYRFHFRFAHASSISMHNDMFRLWRKTYDLAKILEEIDKDVVEAENMLEQMDTKESQDRAEKDRHRLGLFAALAGTAIAMPDWRDMTLAKLFFYDCAEDCSAALTFPLHYILLALLVFSAFGLIYVWIDSALNERKKKTLRKAARQKIDARCFR